MTTFTAGMHHTFLVGAVVALAGAGITLITKKCTWHRRGGRRHLTPARLSQPHTSKERLTLMANLPPDERQRRAEHAKRAYMLRLAKRAVAARRAR